jgi:hypothetical protein
MLQSAATTEVANTNCKSDSNSMMLFCLELPNGHHDTQPNNIHQTGSIIYFNLSSLYKTSIFPANASTKKPFLGITDNMNLCITVKLAKTQKQNYLIPLWIWM